MGISNYDRQMALAKELFLTWDSETLARRFSLEYTADAIWIPFLGRMHRIDRSTGDITVDGQAADFNAHLSIFDAICRDSGPAQLAHQWSTVNNLRGLHHPGVGEQSMYGPYLPLFTGRSRLLADACRAFGGRPFPVGEVGWETDIFPFLPLVFQFWEGDEEFPAQIRLLWDANTLDFVRYETVWYIAGAFFHRLTTLLEQPTA